MSRAIGGASKLLDRATCVLFFVKSQESLVGQGGWFNVETVLRQLYQHQFWPGVETDQHLFWPGVETDQHLFCGQVLRPVDSAQILSPDEVKLSENPAKMLESM